MRKLGFLLFFLGLAISTFSAELLREKFSFDKGWSFHLGDIAFPRIVGHANSYDNAKAGKSWGAAAPDFDDSSWRVLNLPHDWAVESAYDSTENSSQGYRKRGFGWYRKKFNLPQSDKGRYLELEFGGVATHCTVWFNGTLVHRNFCGYTSFTIDITPFANYGDDVNTVVVRVDADAMEGWWYEGAGIYRHTWLTKKSPLHIVTDGVFAHPVKLPNGEWTIPAEVELANSGKTKRNAEVLVRILNPEGKEIQQKSVSTTVESLSTEKVQLSIPISNPQLWDIEHPSLYKVLTTVKEDGKACDRVETNCGFRTIEFTANNGMLLNGKRVQLKGTCNHQDHAGVGVAVPASIWDFRISKLKEMGSNAYRCAHNPPATEFLDACDRLGMLVMDENRNFNVTPEYQRQLEWLIKRDRNHPSVILWSVFNEERMQGTENGYEMVRRMSQVVKKLDSSRPITAAASGGLSTPVNVGHAVDVIGMNYQSENYDMVHKLFSQTPVTSSEDISCWGVRGVYKTDKQLKLHDGYDTQKASWGTTHREGVKRVSERPYLAGNFVWTGFDYRGETQPYEWPACGASFGIMDQCGFPKPVFYFYQSLWTNQNVLEIFPHWNWPTDSIGKKIKVMAMTNADSVSLRLNGKLLENRQADKYYMADWMVPYAPGTLEARGYRNGKEIARKTVQTTGRVVALELMPFRNSIKGDGRDALPISVRAVDKKGQIVPDADMLVEFEVIGDAQNIGVGNGNPNSHEAEKANERKLFHGLAQLIVQGKENGTGEVMVKAKSTGLKEAVLRIKMEESPTIPAILPSNQRLNLDVWRISPVYNTKPNPNQEIPVTDMNSWTITKPGVLHPLYENEYCLFRTLFTPTAAVQKSGTVITFYEVVGEAEVWLDGVMVTEKLSVGNASISFQLPPKNGGRTLTLLVKGAKDKVGMAGMVLGE